MSSIDECEKCRCCNTELDTNAQKLPCGIYCTECVENLKENTRGNSALKFHCPFCEHSHLLHELWSDSNKISLNKTTNNSTQHLNAFKSNLDKVQHKIDQFNLDLLNSSEKIRDYCVKLKNDVQIETELRIKEIQDLSDDLFKKIDDYQLKCLKSLETRTNRRFLNFIQKSEDSHKKLKNSAKNKDLNELFKLTNDLIKKFEIELKKYHNFTFDNELMELKKVNHEKFDQNLLGKFIYRNLSFNENNSAIKMENASDQSISWLKLNTLNKENILCSDYFSSEDTFVIALMNEPKSFQILTFLNEKIQNTQSFSCSWFQRLLGHKIGKICLKAYKEHLVIYYEILSKLSVSRHLVLLDSSLKEIQRVLVDFEIKTIRVNNLNIVCLTANTAKPSVLIYDFSLSVEKSAGQSEHFDQPFYFSHDLKSADFLNGKFYAFFDDRFEIMNGETGLLENTVYIRADNFLFDSVGLFSLYAISSDSMTITEFSVDGVLLDVKHLTRLPVNVNAALDKNEEFILFSKKLNFLIKC